MGKFRTKEEKIDSIIKWKRRQFNKCHLRNKVSQEPLPKAKIGDHVLAWQENAGYFGPASLPIGKCGCVGQYSDHIIIKKFLRITYLRKSYAGVEQFDDPTEKFEIYQPSIILSIGQKSPIDPAQDFSILKPAQKKFIMRLFEEKKARI